MASMKKSDVHKADKFRDAAVRRVRNVETTLRRVRNLSNSSTYAYTEEEVSRIFDHLQGVLDSTRDSFRKATDQQQFSL